MKITAIQTSNFLGARAAMLEVRKRVRRGEVLNQVTP